MAGIGELFVQLLFEGDTSKADKFISKTKEIVKQTDIQIQKNRLLLRYLKDLKEAQGDTAKQKLIKSTFAKEIKNLNLSNAVKEQEKQQTSLKGAVKNTIGTFTKYIATVTAAAYAVKKMTDSLIQQNQEFVNLTRNSDLSLSTFQKWNSVGKMFGIQNAAEQIKGLNDRLFELKLTGANAEGFMLAGIMPTNAEDVMEQLRNRVAGLNDTSASFLLRRMGLDENLLHILRLSSKEFADLNNEVKRFQLTSDQRKQIQETNIQLQIASQKLQYLKDRAILAILPYWAKFLTYISKMAVKIAHWVNQFRKALPVLKNIIKTVTVLTVTFVALSKALKLATAGWILGLTALIAIIDDIATYFMGGESFTGDIMKWIEDFNNMPLNDFIDKLEDVLKHPVPEWMRVLLEIITDIKNITNKKPSKIAEDVKRQQEKNKNFRVEDTYDVMKNPGKYSLGEKLAMADRWLQWYFTGGDLLNNVLHSQERQAQQDIQNNNRSIIINQQNNIKTTEAAKEVMNTLLPFASGLEFANYNTIPSSI